LSTSIDTFKANLIRMGGKFVDAAVDGDLETQIRKIFPDAKVICSAVPEVRGNRPIEGIRTPQTLNDVDVGVVRALFGVAETGSLWLSEVQYKVNALGFLAQHWSCSSIRAPLSPTCTARYSTAAFLKRSTPCS
jgi:L-lactate dehydrogenase complex protein LldG